MENKSLILKKNKYKIIFIFFLIVLECISVLLTPLFIGYSIEGLLKNSYQELIMLVALMLLTLVFGAGRKFYDSRVYAKIYKQMAYDMMVNDTAKKISISKTTAKTMLLKESIDFIELVLPEVAQVLISITGTLWIIYFLEIQIFWATIGSLMLFFIIYGISGKKIYRLNRVYNSQFEKQVDVISSGRSLNFSSHLQKMMKWHINLSDIETINFFSLWLGLSLLLPYSVFITISKDLLPLGEIFSTLTYVYEYIVLIIGLPFSIEKYIRFREILHRFQEKK